MKNKKRMKEKKISNFMWDKVRGFGSERKLNKESKRSFADKNRSHNVLISSVTNINNKKEFISSLTQDRTRGLDSESRYSKTYRASKTSPSRNSSRIIVSATNTNSKIMGGGVDSRASEQINNKSLSFLLLFLIFSFIFMVIGINFVSAATLYGVGVSNGNWSDASNWASSSGEINLNTIKNNNMYY